jgi:hypothetical protein
MFYRDRNAPIQMRIGALLLGGWRLENDLAGEGYFAAEIVM